MKQHRSPTQADKSKESFLHKQIVHPFLKEETAGLMCVCVCVCVCVFMGGGLGRDMVLFENRDVQLEVTCLKKTLADT